MLYTIGYEDKPMRLFLKLLKTYNINCVVDIRTFPYSPKHPFYNIDSLKTKLQEKDIYYLSFSKEFGLRREEKEVYSKQLDYDGKNINYVAIDKVWSTPNFKEGVKRILNGIAKGYNICFLSGETDQLLNHRTLIISEYFYEHEIPVIHLKDEDVIINHKTIIDRIEDHFYHEKRKYEEYLENKEKNANLFTINNAPNKEYWDNFFSDYNFSKGFYLCSLKLGYKDNL